MAAVTLYGNPAKWKKLVKKVMKEDFSWNVSAKKYIEMYNKL